MNWDVSGEMLFLNFSHSDYFDPKPKPLKNIIGEDSIQIIDGGEYVVYSEQIEKYFGHCGVYDMKKKFWNVPPNKMSIYIADEGLLLVTAIPNEKGIHNYYLTLQLADGSYEFSNVIWDEFFENEQYSKYKKIYFP
jgi:hypothetical protein